MRTPDAATLKIKRLFHYQQFKADWLRSTLLEEKIWFSNPADFNDPWDCRPFFYIPGENEPDLKERYVEWFCARNADMTEEERALNAKALREDPAYFKSVVEQFSKLMTNANHEQYRVYCLSSQPDSPLMWSHYTDKHRGVCLEFSCDNGVFGSAMKINYMEKYPQLDFTDPKGDNLLPLIAKSGAWCYEDEYRVVALEKFMTAPVPGMLRTRKNFLKLPHGALKAVIMGCMVSPSDAADLREIIDQQSPRYVALKRAIRVPNRYSLSIETC
jgi:hypothetical protein